MGCETLPEESKLLLATFSAVKPSRVSASICVSALTDCLRRTVVGVAAVYRMLSLIVPPERRKNVGIWTCQKHALDLASGKIE